MRSMDPQVRRGGPQVIPRPAGSRLGDPPPWVALSEEERHLDGDVIEQRMAGTGAARRSPREGQVSKASAVLAPLFVDDGEVYVVLTRRSAALRVHGGEVSFPGGRQEPGEELAATARREAFEEIGLDPASVRLIGELDHLTTITSDSFIVPYVGLLPGRPELVVSPAEVAAVLFVPLAELLDPTHYREERWDLWGTERSIFFFELEGDTVWGATAAMLRQLLGFVTGTVGRGNLGHD
jgi:8-oxo-dGTP pyrophosphatase MutT (NUDIX family)